MSEPWKVQLIAAEDDPRLKDHSYQRELREFARDLEAQGFEVVPDKTEPAGGSFGTSFMVTLMTGTFTVKVAANWKEIAALSTMLATLANAWKERRPGRQVEMMREGENPGGEHKKKSRPGRPPRKPPSRRSPSR